MDFKDITLKLQRKEITREQAKELLNNLKIDTNNLKIDTNNIEVHKCQKRSISVIGMAAMLPGADNINELWNNIINCRDSVEELPDTYLDKSKLYSLEKEKGKTYCKWGGILKNKDDFDGEIFKIYPKEVEAMNYHQKLILKQGLKAIKNAGYDPKKLYGEKIGVYIGAEPTTRKNESFTGDSDAIIASRLSYIFNLTGPTMVINTGCSSSATALHVACEAIRNKEIDTAIVGGVFANLDEETLVLLSQIEMLSFSGKCKTFDKGADGTVLSEGVGVVILKETNEANKDKDTIYGIIKANCANQDGASNGITAPNGIAQENLIKETYKKFNINPNNIEYIETHGTATGLGDPIEVNALVRAFKSFTSKKNYCSLGSIKPNVGHTAAASGVVALIKVLLALNNKTIPALCNFNVLNPLIEIENSPFYINTSSMDWKSENKHPRMAAINSFGHSGTNVHFVIEEYLSDSKYSSQDEDEEIVTDITDEYLNNLMLYTEDYKLKIASSNLDNSDHKKVILLCGTPYDIEDEMKNEIIFNINSNENNLWDEFKDYSIKIIEYLKELSRENFGEKILLHLVIYNNQLLNSIYGLLATVHAENPNINFQIIDIQKEITRAQLISSIKDELTSFDDKYVVYNSEGRFIRKLSEISKIINLDETPWKDEKVYLLIGGSGGVGKALLNRIKGKTKRSKIIVTGRGLEEKSEIINENTIIYKKLDVTNERNVVDFFAEIQNNFGYINGLFYLAGINKDNFLINKSKNEVIEVLAPKVLGLINIDKYCNNINLDFFCTFSSASSILGNVGQADYALANNFINSYCKLREELVEKNERVGKTINISWPYWKDGGMNIPSNKIKNLEAQYGVIPLESDFALDLLETMIVKNLNSTLVLYGNKEIIKESLEAPNMLYKKVNLEISKERDFDLKDKITERLRSILSKITKIEYDKIVATERIDRYGMDSIVIMELNDILVKQFKNLPKALFYQFKTIAEVSDYLIKEYYEECFGWVHGEVNIKPNNYKKEETIYEKQAQITDSECKNEPIAIIGVSGKYGKCNNIEELWTIISKGESIIREIPKDRWSLEDFYEKDMDKAVKEGKSYSKVGAFIDGYSEFDPAFFNISPREAINMDPQERKLMEVSWKCLEDAGYSRRKIKEKIGGNLGVFVGVTKSGYNLYGSQVTENGQRLYPYTSFASMANRLSYFLDVNGPSIAVDTMCSSSLVALHQGCESLRSNDCEMVLVGGVNIYLHPSNYTWLCSQRMLSPDGKCKSFGKNANGFVPGEGIGAVLLKPLSKAIKDNDNIYALISGTSVNHGGRTNGYTIPSPEAQSKLVLNSLKKANVNPRDISYIEAHGTGTNLGDPIEIESLTKAYREYTDDKQYCDIGSIKTNIGHLEAASGIAGLTKIILQLKHNKITPSLNSKELNLNINFEDTPFKVNQDIKEWDLQNKLENKPRISAVSSFGAGGVNAHAIIKEYINTRDTINEENEESIILLSANSKLSLKERLRSLSSYLNSNDGKKALLSDIAYTLQVGRDQMNERVAFIISSKEDLKSKLENYVNDEKSSEGVYKSEYKLDKNTIEMFSTDEDLKNTFESWLQKKKYRKFIELWSKGLNIPWELMYSDNHPRIISLPVYEFEKQSYTVIGQNNSKHEIKENKSEVKVEKDKNISKVEPIIKKEINRIIPEEVSEIKIEDTTKLTLCKLDKIDFEDFNNITCNNKIQLETFEDEVTKIDNYYEKKSVKIKESKSDRALAVNNIMDIEKYLIKTLANSLFINEDEIDKEASFIELGLDSIVGVEWIQLINKKYGISIPATKIYDYSNVKNLSDYLKEIVNISEPVIEIVFDDLYSNEEVANAIEEKKSNHKSLCNTKEIKDYLMESLAETLFIDTNDIDTNKNFLDLGLDSIVGVEWVQKINKKFELSLTATVIYNYSTIHDFNEFIIKKLESHEVINSSINYDLDQLLQGVQNGNIDINQGEKYLERLR